VSIEFKDRGAIASAQAMTVYVSLGNLAASINSHIDKFDKADLAAWRHRLKAGQELMEARRRVEPGKWIAWCKANIKRSRRDIAKLVKIAESEDAQAALSDERAKAREGMRNHRARSGDGANVSPTDDPAPAPVSQSAALTPDPAPAPASPSATLQDGCSRTGKPSRPTSLSLAEVQGRA
jgi:hypothetical protein